MYFNFFKDFEDIEMSCNSPISFPSSYRDNNIISFKEDNFDLNKENFSSEENLNSYIVPKKSLLEKELNFNKISPIINNDNLYNQKIKNEEKNKKSDSTSLTSGQKEESQIKKKNQEIKSSTEIKKLPDYWRMDSAKKHWKTQISKYAKNIINILIKESDLPEDLKKTIHSPNSVKFTANITVSANFRFLMCNLIEVFTIGKEKNKLQKQNYENISKIYEYFDNLGNYNLSDSLRKIKEFFEMKYEDLIQKFYDSYEFITFKNDELTKFYDDGLMKQEKFSLLKDNGLIKLFKMIKKKRNRD